MDELNLFIYGEIGFDAITPDNVQNEIKAHPEAKEIIVHISSPGGSVFEGYTLGNILKNSGKKTTAKIEGFCASIATYIALCCNRVEMAEVGRFLIHNPTLGLDGEEAELKKAADQLDSIKEDLINTYRSKTGMSSAQLSRMMDEETNMTAQEAKSMGFIDAFMTPLHAVAKFTNNNKMEKLETKKVDTSALDKIIARAEEVIKGLLPKAQNVTVELADGSMLFIESEDGEFEGKAVFFVDEEGAATEPATDGTYELTDNRTLTVEGGIVVSVSEETPEEVIDKLQAQIKAMEEAAAEANKKNEEKEKENEKNFTELLTEVKNLKAMTVGTTEPPKKVFTEPKNKSINKQEPKGHPLDDFAASLKANR